VKCRTDPKTRHGLAALVERLWSGFDALEAEAVVVVAVIVASAAAVAGGGAGEGAGAVDFVMTMWAGVGEGFGAGAARQWEVVGGGFVGDAEFEAGVLPFWSVVLDMSASGAVVCDEVGEFVAEGVVWFAWAEVDEAWIEVDGVVAVGGEACGAAQSAVPDDPDL